MRNLTVLSVMLLLLSVLPCAAAADDAVRIVSPDGRVTAAFGLRDGLPHVELALDGRRLGDLDLGPEGRAGAYAVRDVRTRTADGRYRPVWGFRADYPDRYVERTVELSAPGADETALTLVMRAYDEGFAVCYEIPLETYALDEIRRERFDFALVPGTVGWPIPETEATYPEEPVAVRDLDRAASWRLPFTVRTPDGVYASLLEANVVGWPRSYLRADGRGGLRSEFVIGTKTGRGAARSPWRAVLLAPTAGKLVERSYLVENLNEPNRVADADDWIRPGLSSSDLGRLDNASLLASAKVLRRFGVRYLQIDWGWYGTERPWTDAERASYKRKRPDLKDDGWMANTYADPRRPARGYVPYHPHWERLIRFGREGVDLDIPALVRGLKELDMGLCLYLHGLVLESADMDELFALYESWGVAGLKPGFVSWGSQTATDDLRRMAACAARHHLWLDIHDLQVPDGFERTWPNVMISEGGGGEEGHHPVWQDCVLPFARCLAGPFDYTPRFFDPQRSKAHAAALLVVYPGPTAVMRFNETDDLQALVSANPELFGFIGSLPMTYDETRVLADEIGHLVVVARRKGDTWFVGGICGRKARHLDLPLDFLPADASLAGIVTDDSRSRVLESVISETTLGLDLVAGGGFVASFGPGGGASKRR